MSLDVQVEIMQRSLIDELALSANIPIWHETQNVPGKSKPKDQFSASDLIISARALITAVFLRSLMQLFKRAQLGVGFEFG